LVQAHRWTTLTRINAGKLEEGETENAWRNHKQN
jgi:hypothetical protein